MRAIQVRQFGGPEVLVPAVLSDPVPHHDEFLVRVSGAGVNYADTHQAENTYLSSSSLPFVPGGEVVGDVVDPGGLPRRVCGFVSRGGGYAELAVVRKGLAFDVPAPVTDTQALSLLVQGLTAWHLVRTCARVAPGETVVVHAAAGGVGNLAVQLAKAAGAGRVIATASTQHLLDLAADLGADVGVLLDDPTDLEAFGRALDGLLADPARAERIGVAARVWVRDNFLGSSHLVRYMDLIDDLLVA